MLDYTILSKKPTITLYNSDGDKITCKDLLAESFNKEIQTQGKLVVVNKYYTARPDLISLAVYGDDKYADIICKVNGISNPFELNENMTLFIPSINYLSNYNINKLPEKSELLKDIPNNRKNKDKIQVRGNSNLNSVSSKENSKDTIEKINNNHQKLRNERRSPSEQTITDKNYIINKSLGVVIY